jgi:hypothetical protein
MEHNALSTMTHRYSTFPYIDMKEVDFTLVVRLEAWNPAEKVQDLACKPS